MTDNIGVRYSQFKDEYIRGIIYQNYDLASPIGNRFFRMGMNDIYFINSGDKNYFFRVSMAGVFKFEDYVQEAAIINTFNDCGIGVACPVKCKNGGYVISLDAPEGKRFAILFDEVKNNPGSDLTANLFNFGYMVAEMHVAADARSITPSRPPIDLVQLIDKPLELLGRHLANRQDDYKYIQESEKRIAELIDSTLPKHASYYGFCHGDLHLANAFFNGDKPTYFDFDCMGSGWRAHDLAVFLFNQTLGDNNYRNSDGWKSLLNGYNSVRQLDDAEIGAIPAFCALRSIWVISVHTDLSSRNLGCQMFSRGYFDFFIGNFKYWCNLLFSS